MDNSEKKKDLSKLEAWEKKFQEDSLRRAFGSQKNPPKVEITEASISISNTFTP